MANKFQNKRTSVAGRTPNTTNSSNTSYIDAGELAVNLTDQKVFTSNGSAYFEVGANLTNLTVQTITANGTTGSAGQALLSNGTGLYWSSGTGYTGSAGYTGSQGNIGYTGSGGVGYTGSQGPIGYTGSAFTTSINWTQNNAPMAYANTGDTYPKALATLTITTSGGPVQIGAYGDANPLSAGSWGKLALYRDGTMIGSNVHFESSAANENAPYGIIHIDNAAAGTHTYTLYCTVTSGGNVQFGESNGPILNAVELLNVKGYTGSAGAGYTGSQGYTGSKGDIGYTGSQGAQGTQGNIGYTGSKGDIGYTGSQGIQGNLGYTGSQGNIGYTGSKGATGLGFNIAKTYSSVAALTADTSPTGILAGEFALINTNDVENAENSRLYLWNGSVYSYVTDLSGAAGITGPQGSIGYTGSKGDTGTTGYTGSMASVPANTTLKAFTYTISSNTTSITGADDAAETLVYTAGMESVFINGSRQIVSVDYNTTNSTVVTLTSNAMAGDIVQIVALTPAAQIITTGFSNTANATVSTATVVDSFDKTVYRSSKYYVNVTANSKYQMSEVLVLHDGTTSYITEYGMVYSNASIADITSNVNGSAVELVITPTHANATINLKRISLEV